MHEKPVDILLFLAVIALLTLGSIMVFSAGAVFAQAAGEKREDDSEPRAPD